MGTHPAVWFEMIQSRPAAHGPTAAKNQNNEPLTFSLSPRPFSWVSGFYLSHPQSIGRIFFFPDFRQELNRFRRCFPSFSHIFAYFPCLLVEKTVIFDTAQQPWRPCSSACWISLRRRWTFGMFRSQQVAGWCFFCLGSQADSSLNCHDLQLTKSYIVWSGLKLLTAWKWRLMGRE